MIGWSSSSPRITAAKARSNVRPVVFSPDDLPFQLRARIHVSPDPHLELGTPCWLCDGRMNRNGYVRFGWQGREPVAHRTIYEVLVGKIPDDLPILDHLCRNRACCAPHHLEPVTHRVNTLRGEAILFQPRLTGSFAFAP
jgi:hypothetical protein